MPPEALEVPIRGSFVTECSDPPSEPQPPSVLVLLAFVLTLVVFAAAPFAVPLLLLGAVEPVPAVVVLTCLVLYARVGSTTRLRPQFGLWVRNLRNPYIAPGNWTREWWLRPTWDDPVTIRLVALGVHVSLLALWIVLLPGRFLGFGVWNMYRLIANEE